MLRSIRARFERMGLQRRIMLYVSAGLVVVLAAYGLVGLQAIRQSTDLVFQERLMVARTVAHQIDNDLSHLESELDDSGASVGSALAANRQADVRDAIDTLHQHWLLYHHFDNPCVITLTDPNGIVLWSDPSNANLLSSDLSKRPSFQAAFQSRQSAIADSDALDGSGHNTLSFATPLRASGRIVGFLLGDINLSHISQYLAPTLDVSEPSYTLELINAEGLVLASTRPERQGNISQHFQLTQQLLGEEQSGVVTHQPESASTDQSHVIAFAPLNGPHWGIVVEEGQDAALAMPRALQNQLLLFGVLVLLGGMVLAWITTRSVVQPVNALTHATQDIASGDLDRPLDITGEDEVGKLARSFDEMRVELKQSREEIALWNHELEARVEQRTRELQALVESSHALTSTLELDALFDILMKRTNEILPAAEAVVLFLVEAEMNKLAVRSTFGFDAAYCANLRLDLDEAIGGQAFQSQAPALLKTSAEVTASQANLSADNREHFIRALGYREVQSALGVPLVSKGARLGALVIYSLSRETAFAESDVLVLQALADQAAAAIENARLYQEAREVGALRELNRLKSEFVARASHELRTPMTAIKSLAETLLRPDLDLEEETQREFLEGIDSATDRLSRIVNQLLMLSRVEAGRLEMQSAPLDLAALVGRVVGQFRAQSPQRIIKVSADPLLPRALGDAERVEDVLTNLISNALKYSLADAPVAIQTQSQDGVVEVLVQDEGIGIPAEARDKIFERFYRVDNLVTRRIGGAGLGLHLCKTYVEAMSGSIHVESEEGRGSIFRFTLPRANEAG